MKQHAILVLAGLLVACTRTVQTLTPQGMVETRESYPQYETIRSKKELKLSLADQDRIRDYYRRHRSWPLSEQGFTMASDTNYQLVVALRRRGFTDLDFISRGPDTLRIHYAFRTLGNLRYDKEEPATLSGLGRTYTGSFVFVADPVSGISFRQVMDPQRRRWYWPFGPKN